jgi:two-component sensor histidine kinase/CHASE3 domain sensor protein
MQHLQRPLRTQRALVATVALSFGFLVASAAIMWNLARSAEEADRWVLRTLEAQQRIASILTLMTAAESGQRGFLLTRDDEFLAPYTTAQNTIPLELSALRQLVADNPFQLTRVDELAATAEARLAALGDVLRILNENRSNESAQVLRERSRRLMDAFRNQIAALNHAEDQRLAQREQQVGASRDRFFQAVTAMLLSCGVLALFALVSIRRYVATLESSRALLRDQNQLLEERVKARTLDLQHAAELATRERSRAESLLTDVNHRVGNNLALVSSFLTMQKRAVSHPEAAKALDAARARVQAIASAHRKLRLGADFATVRANEVLNAVVDDISAGLPPGDAIKISCDVAPLEINARDAVSLGVLTSELVMNAVKHAFGTGECGFVNVRFAKPEEAAPFIEVADNGVGWHEKQKHESASLGGRIIDMVARQFGGQPERVPYRDDEQRPGTRIRIELNNLQLVQHPS